MSTPLHILAQVPAGGSLADALAGALVGKPFNDVVFLAPARAGHDGAMRAVYANSRILSAASAYFRELLSKEGSTGEIESTLGDEDDLDALETLLETRSEISFPEDEEMKTSEPAAESTTSVPTSSSPLTGARVVVLDDVTADTLKVVIFYIYTGEIYFLPLSSSASFGDEARAAHALKHPDRPIASCKSVYRFAEEADLDELKQVADAHLFAGLTAENILDEVFSTFSSQYPAILRRQVDLLLERFWTPATRAALGPIVERVVRGEMPHAEPALNMLLGEIPPVPRTAAPTTDPSATSPPNAATPPTAKPLASDPGSAAPAPARSSPSSSARPTATPAPSFADIQAPAPHASTFAAPPAVWRTGLSASHTPTVTPTFAASAPPRSPPPPAAPSTADALAPAPHISALNAQPAIAPTATAPAAIHAPEAAPAGLSVEDSASSPHAGASTAGRLAAALERAGAARDREVQPAAPEAVAAQATAAPEKGSSTWWRDVLRNSVVVDLDEESMHAPDDGSGGWTATDDGCWDGWATSEAEDGSVAHMAAVPPGTTHLANAPAFGGQAIAQAGAPAHTAATQEIESGQSSSMPEHDTMHKAGVHALGHEERGVGMRHVTSAALGDGPAVTRQPGERVTTESAAAGRPHARCLQSRSTAATGVRLLWRTRRGRRRGGLRARTSD